jgi:dihydroflavonol-4-reductase
MRVCVTGASGHIGSNIVHELAGRGHAVSVSARSLDRLRALEGLSVDRHVGDVLDEKSLRAAMDGAEVLFHAAAVYKNWTKDPEEMPRVALGGTRNALRAAKDAGVRRVVYTSSCNAVGFAKDLAVPPDEQTWNDSPHLPYVRAKVESERLAHEMAKELGIELVAVLPTAVLGRFDYAITPSTRTFADVVNRKGPLGFPMNLVDVRDVAIGHVLAAEKGTPGERYLLGSENVDVETMAKLVTEETGVAPKVVLPPAWLLATIATVAETVSSITGKEPMMTRALVRELTSSKGIVFDCSKAKRELGLEPRPAREVVREAARWAAFVGVVDEAIGAKLPPDPAWTTKVAPVEKAA